MKRYLLAQIVWVFLFSSLGLGCSSVSDFSRETYRKGFLSPDSFREGAIGVLPLSGADKTERYVDTAREIFHKTIHELQPRMNPLPLPLSPEKEVWNERELDRFKAMSRFLLQTQLRQVDLAEGATHIQIMGRLWDVEQGDILWEGIGESRGNLFLFFPTVPASFETAMEVASRGLIRKLPVSQ